MTIYISPNPGKTSASEIALRAAQILLTHGAAVLMSDALRESCNTAGVIYLPLERCLKRADVILTIGGDGTILHEANLSLRYAKPILGINRRNGNKAGRCGAGRFPAGQPDAFIRPGAWSGRLGGARPQ